MLSYRPHPDSRRKIETDHTFKFGIVIPMSLLPLDQARGRFEWMGAIKLKCGRVLLKKAEIYFRLMEY